MTLDAKAIDILSAVTTRSPRLLQGTSRWESRAHGGGTPVVQSVTRERLQDKGIRTERDPYRLTDAGLSCARSVRR
jgi:hypothetical protein